MFNGDQRTIYWSVVHLNSLQRSNLVKTENKSTYKVWRIFKRSKQIDNQRKNVKHI